MADKMEIGLTDFIESNINPRGKGRSRRSREKCSSGPSPTTTVQKGRGRGGISRLVTLEEMNRTLERAARNLAIVREAVEATADALKKRSDANKAMKQYNGMPLKRRVMNVQRAIPGIPHYIRSVAQRKYHVDNRKRESPVTSRGRDGHTHTTSQRKGPTAEELDAELDAYAKERQMSEAS